jgi:hypothetical protein
MRVLLPLASAGQPDRLTGDLQSPGIGNLVRHDEPAAGGPELEPPWYSLDHTFVMDDGEATLPTPPIK